MSSYTETESFEGKLIKIIIESHLLTDMELEKVIEFCLRVKPDFINVSLKNNNIEEASQHIRNLKKGLAGDVKIKISKFIICPIDDLSYTQFSAKVHAKTRLL